MTTAAAPQASTTTPVLTAEQLADYERDGFVVLRGFADSSVGAQMEQRVRELADAAAGGADVRPAVLLPEARATASAQRPEDLLSKIFRLHRDPAFAGFLEDPRLLGIVTQLLGPGIDVFLSQFIFKNVGAMGQPWHQDSFYFPFDVPEGRPTHQVGVWLAVSEATLENGCLHVLPGSHVEPVHEHVPDQRPDANYGYVEIVDHDMSRAVPVLMQPGDLLVFDSHLMHRSTDNVSDGRRTAMVFHFGPTGTVDHVKERLGFTIHDWVTVA